MTPRDEDPLIQAAMSLREQSPEVWGRFVEAVRLYSEVTTRGLLRSPPDKLIANQGRAQGVADFALTLEQAPLRFEEIRNRRRA